MDRRTFVAGLGAGLIACSGAAPAQPRDGVARIGYLRRTSPQPADIAALRQGLRELGWVEGRNIVIDERYADGDAANLPRLARELQQLKVGVLVVDGGLTVEAVRPLSGATPIVFALAADPVGSKFVASLDRPGGNITGLTNFSAQLAPKRLQLLREIVPAGRVGFLYNPANVSPSALEQFRAAARSLDVDLVLVPARSAAALPEALARLGRDKVAALIVGTDATFFSERSRIVGSTTQMRLPAVYPEREFCEAGGLVCYGVSNAANFFRAAAYVDKILRGARAGDLPVEQPTRFDLLVNAGAAKALGVAVPQSLLLRANDVIQ